VSSQSGRGNLSTRKHGIGGYRSNNSPGYAQSVRDVNVRLAAGREMRRRNRPPMFARIRDALEQIR